MKKYRFFIYLAMVVVLVAIAGCTDVPRLELIIYPEESEVPFDVEVRAEIVYQCDLDGEIDYHIAEVQLINETTGEFWPIEEMDKIDKYLFIWSKEITEPGQYQVMVEIRSEQEDLHLLARSYFLALDPNAVSTTTTSVTTSSTTTIPLISTTSSSTSSSSTTTTSIANFPPTVTIYGSNGRVEYVEEICPPIINIKADDEEDGSLDKSQVKLYANGVYLADGFYHKLQDMTDGNYELTAIATDSDGATASATMRIIVYPFYLYIREDAVYSPHGSIDQYAMACYGDFCIKEAEPFGHSLIGVYNRQTGELIYVIDEGHGSANSFKALAISAYYFAVMFHGGLNGGIWVRDIATGELVAYFSIDFFWHAMAFDETGRNIAINRGCDPPLYFITNHDLALAAFMANSGVDYPWIFRLEDGVSQYGWSLCVNPWGEHAGFSSALGRSHLQEDFKFLASKNSFLSDQLVLGHPEFITDPILKNQLFENVIRPLVAKFGHHPNIHSWDIINERKWISQVAKEDVANFVSEIAQIIYTEAPDAQVSEGVNSRCDLDQWMINSVNLIQYHYFDYMEPDCPLDYDITQLPYGLPVLLGEVEPTFIRYKLDTIFRNRCLGALFWSLNGHDGFDFRSVADEYKNWFENQ